MYQYKNTYGYVYLNLGIIKKAYNEKKYAKIIHFPIKTITTRESKIIFTIAMKNKTNKPGGNMQEISM